MNNKKISFIICSNDEFATKECITYIDLLDIPTGYTVDVILINDANSMTSGYNEGMQSSDAKYKVYMHQDVYILNKNFLHDLLDIFSDNSVGMFGLVGNTSLAPDGGAWSDGMHRRVGQVYLDTILDKSISIFGKTSSPYTEVIGLDGLLMATQYDIPWREDLFKGWDFYDLSQSLEFIRAGYKVVVPYMETPWALHDNDVLNLSNYDKWREVFKKEYYNDYSKA